MEVYDTTSSEDHGRYTTIYIISICIILIIVLQGIVCYLVIRKNKSDNQNSTQEKNTTNEVNNASVSIASNSNNSPSKQRKRNKYSLEQALDIQTDVTPELQNQRASPTKTSPKKPNTPEMQTPTKSDSLTCQNVSEAYQTDSRIKDYYTSDFDRYFVTIRFKANDATIKQPKCLFFDKDFNWYENIKMALYCKDVYHINCLENFLQEKNFEIKKCPGCEVDLSYNNMKKLLGDNLTPLKKEEFVDKNLENDKSQCDVSNMELLNNDNSYVEEQEKGNKEKLDADMTLSLDNIKNSVVEKKNSL